MKSKLIRIAPILLIIAIAILAITAIVSIGRMMLGGGSNQPAQKTEEQEASIVELLKNEVGRSVKMTVRGPIVANEDARSYTVEISNSQRSLKTYKGYTAEVIDDVKLDNNSAAYDELVYESDYVAARAVGRPRQTNYGVSSCRDWPATLMQPSKTSPPANRWASGTIRPARSSTTRRPKPTSS